MFFYFKLSNLKAPLSALGNDCLLSDPQIITNPELGDIFAGGNIPDAWEDFMAQHECNEFCHSFKVPREFN